MGLFNRKEGGMMDAIRCDEKDFLIWKWRPAGQAVNSTKKENAIRYGSSLNVRPGQAAIFLYMNKNGEYDVIRGPYSDIIKTDNFPVLSSIVGAAYAGGTPFQAEVYYVNMMRGLEVPFMIPFFRIVPAEPQYKAYDIQVAVKGSLVFEVSTDNEYIKYLFEAWGGNDVTLEELKSKMSTLLTQEIKQIVTNIPKDTGIFVMHFNQLIGEIGQYVLRRLEERLASRFGILATDVLISDIRYNEDSESYDRLLQITEKQAHKFNLEAEKTALLSHKIERAGMITDAVVRNVTALEMARMQLKNARNIFSRSRKEGQRAMKSQTEAARVQADLESQTMYMEAHKLNQETEVKKSAFAAMRSRGISLGLGRSSGSEAMVDAALGKAVSQEIERTFAPAPSQPGPSVPPPLPKQEMKEYHIVVNGEQYGPCAVDVLKQLYSSSQIDRNTLAWCEGMPSWSAIESISELYNALSAPSSTKTPPPLPKM